MMKQQQRAVIHTETGVVGVRGNGADADGAFTGPTLSGCRYTPGGAFVLRFNASLLGGESLLLRDWDYNATGGWSANPYNDSDAKCVLTAAPSTHPHAGYL